MKVYRRGIVHSGDAKNSSQSLTFPMPCVTSRGRWLCACRAAPAKIPHHEQRPIITWSDDEGTTWKPPIEPFVPPPIGGKPGRFRIATLTELADGHLLAALNWVDYSDPAAPYFNEETEGLLDTRVFLSHSFDDGITWDAPRLVDTSPFQVPTPLTGPNLRLRDGRLACQIELNKAYTDLTPWRHASVLLFSSDSGSTWSDHRVITSDPDNRMFYWDQRPAVLPDGSVFDVFWTFDRDTAAYRTIHAVRSVDHGGTWSPLWDTGVEGQPGPVFALPDGTLAMPVVDRSGPPKIIVRRSQDEGNTWPDDDLLVVYDDAVKAQNDEKQSMQDAWAEMYAFSVGLPNIAPLPGGGALLVYYAGTETNNTAIHWAEIR